MSLKIDKIAWGKIKIGDDQYHDVLISGNLVEERDYPKLVEYFGTSHEIGKWEVERLFENDPEVIIIGTGWASVLKVPEVIKEEADQKGIFYKALKSPKAVKEYNKLLKEGKKVNVLIHSTC
ncbi:MAG: MTH938/NDUFAF3 family protein [Patescibacteria group bacterium]|nr:hypothetical protein [Patescibacteria group bacterium]